MKKIALLILLSLCMGTIFNRVLPPVYADEIQSATSAPFYKYLIIIPDNESWMKTLQPFVDWKTREGLHYFSDFPANCLPVKVTNLTEITNLYGSANVSSIREYIIDLWENCSYGIGLSTLKYVLLAGDVKYVPSYLYNVTIRGSPYTYATDQYYADFCDSFLNIINPTIDKTDWKAEVYVGRFPVNSAEELRIAVNKTVTYEMYLDGLQQNPVGWQRRMLFLGAIMDNGYKSSGNLVWKDGAYVAELIKQNCDNWWTGNLGSIPSPTTLFDTNNNLTLWSPGYSYLNNQHNLTSANTIDQISNVGFSAILSVSHGNLQSIQGRNSSVPDSWNPPFFFSSNVSSLRNNYALPFWFADACNTGAFQADLWKAGDRCLGEELFLAYPATCGGVVGFIGCSNLSWYQLYYAVPPNRPEVLETISDRLANLTFYELYYASTPTSYSAAKWGLGAALFEAKRLYNETSWGFGAPNEMHMATCLGFNLIGDPSLQIWPEKPNDATSWYNITAPNTVRTGEDFSVNVRVLVNPSGGSYPPQGPREGAKVCISRVDNGSVWCAVNLTDINGNATFTAPTMPGIYNLTVVDHPYLMPYLSQIEVTEPIHDVAVTNVTTSEIVIDQGLSLSINVAVANQGETSESFNVTVYANQTSIQTKNVTLASGNSTIINFLWNTTGFVLGNYTIRAEAEQVPSETNTSNNIYTTSYMITIVPEFPEDRALLLVLPLTTVSLAFVRRKRQRRA
jgi:hypothetical protein